MRKFFVGLVVSTLLALGVVQQRVSLVAMGYDVEALGSQRDDLLDQHRVLHYNVLALQSPVILDERLARQAVQLAPPAEIQVVTPRLSLAPAVSMWSGPPVLEASSWWKQALRQSARWLENGRQAVAAPAKEEP